MTNHSISKLILIGILTILAINSHAQLTINTKLKLQLGAILSTDQGIREYLDSKTSDKKKDTLSRLLNYPKDSLNTNMWAIMRNIDSVNLRKIESIIAEFGYPGKKLVGEPENTTAFFVIQHSDKISEYYPIVVKAAEKGELPFRYAAMMLDRKLTEQGKEQIYGTQAAMTVIMNPKTGEKEPFKYVKPIKDPKNVNKRRKEAGFDSTVEANAERMGIVYQVYTTGQIKEILKK